MAKRKSYVDFEQGQDLFLRGVSDTHPSMRPIPGENVGTTYQIQKDFKRTREYHPSTRSTREHV